MSLTITKELLLKYDKPGPRYTSYPTAPEWSNDVQEAVYQDKLTEFGLSEKTLSVYIHIPFCQSLCTFCACSVVIRPYDAKYGEEYLQHLFREMDLVEQWIGRTRKVRQLHFGGGTPTFLNEDQIVRLFSKLNELFDIDLNGEIAIEIDPRTVDKKKIEKLRELGFNRVSMGVQDFNDEVQNAVHRHQSFNIVQEVTAWCRELQFHSINYDLIYGLPHQTVDSMAQTIEQVVALRPERIAFYSFAYVPWLKRHQNKVSPDQLPTSEQKLEIFLKGQEKFLAAGYEAIAMDHFALGQDELAKAFREGSLYRNFMGYTVKPADEYLGFGMTAIGFIENTYFQNQKTLPDYYQALARHELPIERGKILSEDDQIRQWVINALMCQFRVDKKKFAQRFGYDFDDYFKAGQRHLMQCCEDGLVTMQGAIIHATELGKIFIRNVCMGFDWYLHQPQAHRQFSRTV